MKQIVYIANSESKQIYVWKLNTEGTLNLIQIVDILGQVQPMLVSYDKRFLYVGVRPKFRIITYRIEPTNGSLSLVGEFKLFSSPTHISTDYMGRFLFVSSYRGGCINVISLEKGIPTTIVYTIGSLYGCHSSNIFFDNYTLWVLALKQDYIYLFKVKKNGMLVPQVPKNLKTISGAGPRHMVFHINKRYAYVLNELNSSIDVWYLNNLNNDIKCIQTLDIMPIGFNKQRWAADIHITPNGSYLYACDRSSSMLTIFSISENDGKLIIKGFQPTEMQPRSFSIDDYGKFLISAGQKSNHITLYKIKEIDGSLEKKERYPVGQGPTWVVITKY